MTLVCVDNDFTVKFVHTLPRGCWQWQPTAGYCVRRLWKPVANVMLERISWRRRIVGTTAVYRSLSLTF